MARKRRVGWVPGCVVDWQQDRRRGCRPRSEGWNTPWLRSDRWCAPLALAGQLQIVASDPHDKPASAMHAAAHHPCWPLGIACTHSFHASARSILSRYAECCLVTGDPSPIGPGLPCAVAIRFWHGRLVGVGWRAACGDKRIAVSAGALRCRSSAPDSMAGGRLHCTAWSGQATVPCWPITAGTSRWRRSWIAPRHPATAARGHGSSPDHLRGIRHSRIAHVARSCRNYFKYARDQVSAIGIPRQCIPMRCDREAA